MVQMLSGELGHCTSQPPLRQMLGSHPAVVAGRQHCCQLCSEGAKYLGLKDHMEVSPLGDGHCEWTEAPKSCSASWPKQLLVSVILRLISIQIPFEDGAQSTLSQLV